jgi:hypothetical protein
MSAESRLDYFANNAPAVPEWFKPSGDLPPEPISITEKFDQERAHAFFKAARNQVPAELSDVAQYWRYDLPAARLIHQAAIAEIAYFQWRRYYAQKMVEALSEVQP